MVSSMPAINVITKQHIKVIHEGVKYPCNQCDYKAKWKSSLLTHMKSKHDITSPCDQCDYKAKQIDCDKCAI